MTSSSENTQGNTPLLFTPMTIRGLHMRNRIIASPMCQYLSVDGAPADWHLMHLGRLAIGGCGVAFGEETAVEPAGRKTHACAGLYSAGHVAAYRELTDMIKSHGAVPAIQLGHSGRKGSCHGAMEDWRPLTDVDAANGITPDIFTLGKIIGGGFPLAALGASAEIMQHFDKVIAGGDKWLMQLGTLSGHRVASVAGIKTMEILRRPGQYEQLRQTGKRLQNMQSDRLNKAGIPHQIVGDETLFDVLFTHDSCIDYRSTKHNQPALTALYNQTLREQGILKSPSKLYPSLAISEADMLKTEAAVHRAVDAIADICS